MYDDAPRSRRHGGLATALALIGCAMLGTAAAYGYRSYTGTPGSMQPPPVITADSSTPTKIVPPRGRRSASSKVDQDRLATAGKRADGLEAGGAGRAQGAWNPGCSACGASGAGARRLQRRRHATAVHAPLAVSTEPRKVRTVTIRPDGADRRAGARLLLRPRPTRSAAAPPPPAPKAAARAAARSGSPISLDPQPASEPRPAPPPRTRTARPPPAEPAPRSRRPPHRRLPGAALIAAERKRGAKRPFAALQAKFPNELGGRQPVIRRADLGSKGVFYRANGGAVRIARRRPASSARATRPPAASASFRTEFVRPGRSARTPAAWAYHVVPATGFHLAGKRYIPRR